MGSEMCIRDSSNVINNDKDVNDKLKVVFMEEYNVSLAEVLMPAADFSEQISLAGTEASGTGNMKLMLNGAVTLGTLDGANVEIANAVGDDNIIIFGLKTPEVEQLKQRGYHPMDYINNNRVLKDVIDFINAGIDGKTFGEFTSSLMNVDPYMALADFADYQKAQQLSAEIYKDKERFAKMSLMNISGAGIFSADRAITEYAENIWHTKPVAFPQEKSAPAPKKEAAAKKPAAKKQVPWMTKTTNRFKKLKDEAVQELTAKQQEQYAKALAKYEAEKAAEKAKKAAEKKAAAKKPAAKKKTTAKESAE